MHELFYFIIAVFLIIMIHKSNNDIYEPLFYPDERQYIPCKNKYEGPGETSISMMNKKISKPIKGMLSSLNKNFNETGDKNHFNLHDCKEYDEKTQIDFIYNHKIINHGENKENITLKDHYDYHYSPTETNYAVTYEFINNKKETDFNDHILSVRQKINESDDRF